MLPAQLSFGLGLSRRRVVLLCTASLVSLSLAYYHFLSVSRTPLLVVQPPPYTPFSERKCTPGQPCVQTELDLLRLHKQGVLQAAGRPGHQLSCPPAAYSNGSWVPGSPKSPRWREVPERMTASLDAIKFGGFEGCASSRQVGWALGADVPEQWDRFPNVTSWGWVPGDECREMEDWDKERVVRHLIEDGGWLLIGGKSALEGFMS